MKNQFYCDKCKDFVIPVEGVTSVSSRGYHWCVKHARIRKIYGDIVVEFPSEGKLIPETIMIGETR